MSDKDGRGAMRGVAAEVLVLAILDVPVEGVLAQASPGTAPTRQNCGTHWTPRVQDPEADVNPCPKGCERGERQLVHAYKQGDRTVYAARYQCYRVPPVARRPPPDDSPFGRARAQIEKPDAKPAGTIEPAGGAWGAFARLKGPGFGRATGVVGLWYPNDDTSRLPAMRTSITLAGRPGADELRVQMPLDPERTGPRGDFSRGTLHIVLQLPNGKAAVYAGTYSVGGATAAGEPRLVTGAPHGVSVAGGETQSSRYANTGRHDAQAFASGLIAMHGRWPVESAAAVSFGASPIQMSGRWPAALAAVAFAGDRLQMTGRWPIESFDDVSFRSGAVRMSGRWPASTAEVAVASDRVQMTGRWPVQSPGAVTFQARTLVMTGRWSATLASTVFTTDAVRMTGRWPQ